MTDQYYADIYHFVRSWVSKPLQVAAVVPSSGALARLMVRDIAPTAGPVLELGPGTGAFTRALLARGFQETDLTLIEINRGFAELLQKRFAQARVLCMDASNLSLANLFPNANVGAVLSGLGLLSMPPRKVIAILAGAFTYLRDGGAFYQFTYSLGCPIPRSILDRLDLKATRIGSTVRNLPPASVYRIDRRPAAQVRGHPPALETGNSSLPSGAKVEE